MVQLGDFEYYELLFKSEEEILGGYPLSVCLLIIAYLHLCNTLTQKAHNRNDIFLVVRLFIQKHSVNNTKSTK